jgi:superfamily II DNA/RNA helicase
MIAHIRHHVALMPPAKTPSPIALILVPTRELAIQVDKSFHIFWRLFHIKSVALYGGTDKDAQIDSMRTEGGMHCAVATPGRLIDLVKGKSLSLARVSYMVLDEADRMLALGFFEQLDYISRQIRPDRQAILFSATFPGKLREAAYSWVRDAVSVRCNSIEVNHIDKPRADHDEAMEPTASDELEESSSTVLQSSQNLLSLPKTITQIVHVCASHKKPRLLIKSINKIREQERLDGVRQPGALLIFCTKIKTIKFVEDFLRRQQVKASVLHGQLPQAVREKTLNEFKAVSLNLVYL